MLSIVLHWVVWWLLRIFLDICWKCFFKVDSWDTCSSTSFVQLDKYEIWDSVFCFREIHGLKNNCAEFPKPWGLTVLWCYTRPSFEDFVGSDRMQMPSEWWNGSFPPSLAILREPTKKISRKTLRNPSMLFLLFFLLVFLICRWIGIQVTAYFATFKKGGIFIKKTPRTESQVFDLDEPWNQSAMAMWFHRWPWRCIIIIKIFINMGWADFDMIGY